MADERKDCCKQPENLESRGSGKPELSLLVCRVCHCRHFELTLDPGVVGVIGAALGG